MDDLISRAAALKAIDCWHIDFNSMDGAKVQKDCWRTIKELPAVDAAPVVRCKDCKDGTVTEHGELFCEWYYGFNPADGGPNGYCSHGERRDEGETGND